MTASKTVALGRDYSSFPSGDQAYDPPTEPDDFSPEYPFPETQVERDQQTRREILAEHGQKILDMRQGLFDIHEVIDAVLEYLQIDIVPVEKVMPPGRLVAIERTEKGEDDDGE